MATATDICNMALVKIGEKRITTAGFATPTNERERLCSEHYERLRDAELRKNVWNFAIKRAVLSEDASEPEGEDYAVRYANPSDMLRLVDIFETDDYRIESGFILCNVSDELNVRYVRRVTVVNDMDDLFRDALACRIAAELCNRISGKRALKADVISEYTAFMAQAANVDAIEEPARDFPESDLITCRV
jgi:hypothetical protein